MKIPDEVWAILNDDEKLAANLAFAQSKSSWQAGEIMEKSHYKYLEIQTRAKKYLKMFTEHWLKYGTLVPPEVDMHPGVREYFYTLIVQRKGIKEAADLNSFKELQKPSIRVRLIKEAFDKLAKDLQPPSVDTLQLIRDFDKYNNFRVLPRELQQPSAFKRRNKTKLVKHLKTLTNIQPVILEFIKDKYQTKSTRNIIFMPLVHRHFEEKYEIVPIKNTKENINLISQFGIYLFDEEFMAHEFALLIIGYTFKEGKTCKDGQAFWPEFRKMQEFAFNNEHLHNMTVTRRSFEDAYKRLF